MILRFLLVGEGLSDAETISGGMNLHRMREDRNCVCGDSEERQKER